MQLHAYRRTEAASVNLFGITIEFKPNEHKDVVGETDHEAAIKRLLEIPEAYRPYMGPGSAVAESASAPAPAPSASQAPAPGPGADNDDDDDDGDGDEPLLAASGLPESFKLWESEDGQTGEGITLDQAVLGAFERSNLDREEWNLNDEDDRESLILAEVERRRAEVIAAKQAEADAAAAQATAAAKGAQDAGETPANPYVFTNGDQTVDLSDMTGPQLRAFAADNGISLPGGNSTKVGELRDLVAKSLRDE